MKKRFLGILTFVLAFVVSITTLMGCNLITIDEDRDSNQVVASVNIVKEYEIKKYDIMLGYINYGYYYTQYYGYTSQKAMQLVLDGLVNNAVFYQGAMADFEQGNAPFTDCIKNSNVAKYSSDRYLTDDEITESKYSTMKLIDDYLDSFSEEDEKKQDTFNGTIRDVPTNASNDKEVSFEDKKDFVAKGFDLTSSTERINAFNKLIKFFRNNNLLGSDYDGKTIESTEYYKTTLENYKESQIIENYEKLIKANAVSDVEYSDINSLYLEKKAEQESFNNTQFVEALDGATASSPILYSAFGKYGYVYNLLLSASDSQKEQVEEIEYEELSAEYNSAVNSIYSNIKVSDLRDTWINAGYDFDYDSKKFTGDYTFAKDAKNSLAFNGNVVKLNNDEENPEYRAESDKMSFNDFIDYMELYVYGQNVSPVIDNNSANYMVYESNSVIEEYDAKINELLFAYSSDSGSLNTYKGYAIKPAVDGSNSETYVKAFADAGRKLLEMGGSSYIVVATQYGYHIIFFSEVFEANYNYNSLTDYLNATVGNSDWASEFNSIKGNFEDYEDTNSYLYILTNEIFSAKQTKAFTDKQNELVNTYVYNADTKKVEYKLSLDKIF